MAKNKPSEAGDPGSTDTYPLGVVSRLTGLTPDSLRAWERRYNAVEPLRTPGGSRRYRESDVRRLRLLKRATENGFPIGDLAALDDSELQRRAGPEADAPGAPIQEIVRALEALDAHRAENLIALQLSALGPMDFCRKIALPLLRLIGDEWARERLCIAGEHLGSAILRTQLGSALRPTPSSMSGPAIVFATPSGERHEFGSLVAALSAMGSGADSIYLGSDLPSSELLTAAERTGAVAVGLGFVTLSADVCASTLAEIRGGLPDQVRLWVGGPALKNVEVPEGVDLVDSLDNLDRKVALLAEARGPGSKGTHV